VSTIGIVELMKSAGVLTNKYYDYFTPLITAAMFYLVMTLTISYVANMFERKLNAND
jgi:ABC-type amino acid transport system permease subunit